MAPKSGILVALALAILGSMICSLIQTEINQMSAFYLLPSRAWEFAIGGLVLFLPTPSERYRNPTATVGLAAIVLASLLFDDHLKYPSLWSAVPVIGASVVVWAGSTLFALRNSLAQFCGKISYSLYLWHWPILTVGHYLDYGSKPLETLVLLMLTVAISWASFILIETPFRDMFRKPRNSWLSTLAIGASLAITACALLIATDGWPTRISDRMLDVIQRAVHRSEYRDGICFLGPEQKFSDFDSKCFDSEPNSKKPTLAIWGDSHAAHLYPGIAKQPWVEKYKVVQMTASVCSPLPIAVNKHRVYCPTIQKEIREFLRKTKPEVVILAASWRGYIGGSDLTSSSPDVLTLADLQKLIQSLFEDGIGRVIVVGPINDWSLPLPQVFFKDNFLTGSAWKGRSLSPDADVLAVKDQQYRAAITKTGARYVSLFDALCIGNQCLTLIPGWRAEALFQFDPNHLTADGSEWVAEQLIGPALGEPTQKTSFVALNKIFEFHDKAVGQKYLTSGWMPAEGWGTWTASSQRPGVINFPINPSHPPSSMKLSFWGQLGPTLPEEHFLIKVDGDDTIETKVTQANPIVEQVFLLGEGARKRMVETGRLRIEFLASEGKSPKNMGLNDDVRVLGFGIRELTLLP
jgi:hypothetical protein